MASEDALIDLSDAVYYTGHPASTIRRWASEGRITRHGSGRGNVRYDVREFNHAVRDEWTKELIRPGDAPPLPHNRPAAA